MNAIIVAVTYLAAIGAFLYGWVWNIITIFQSSDAMTTGALAVRIIGIPVGIIGAFLGYF